MFLFLLAAASCAVIDKAKGHAELAQAVEARIQAKTGWHEGTPEKEQIDARVKSLLEGGLTFKNAIEIALVNNAALQATYEDLGISQADMVQAGLLKNPVLGFSLGLPLSRAGHLEMEFSVVQEFLDLFMLPLRKRVAKEQFLLDVQRVSHEALEVAAECGKAFIDVQAKERVVEVHRVVVQSYDVAATLAQAQKKAGNIDDYTLTQHLNALVKAQVELSRVELEWVEAREGLNLLLGLEGEQARWQLKEPLPVLPAEEPQVTNVEALVDQGRLDVAAARKHQALLLQGVDLAKTWRWFGTIELGAHLHQDPNGPELVGPTLTLDLPIFDQRQAFIARLEAEQRQADRRLNALLQKARSEARVALAKTKHTREVAMKYRDVVLPAQDALNALSLRKYNSMLIGLYELLENKNHQLEASLEYVEALRAYWVAQVELTRALGGRRAEAQPKVPLLPEPSKTKTQEHEHHGHP
ncbi:MAG: TolC family protein [Myxococcaceae bacterium]|nr:TolC family protein [Myxococcaceae bacterium]